MITTKNIGVWMNHSIAYIMEFTAGLITTKRIELKLDEIELINNQAFEKLRQSSAYYNKLVETIKGCKEVVLFGPTYAKVKLYNVLRADGRFADTRFGITKTDNMDELQLQEFVMNYFSKCYSVNGA